jgi:hypothetical protein
MSQLVTVLDRCIEGADDNAFCNIVNRKARHSRALYCFSTW